MTLTADEIDFAELERLLAYLDQFGQNCTSVSPHDCMTVAKYVTTSPCEDHPVYWCVGRLDAFIAETEHGGFLCQVCNAPVGIGVHWTVERL